MTHHTLDELKRQALRAGQGEQCLVDADVLLELLEKVAGVEDTPSPQGLWTGGYEAGWEECAESLDPVCSPDRAERAWNRLQKP